MKTGYIQLLVLLITNFSVLCAQPTHILLWEHNTPNYRETGERINIDTTDVIRISNVQHPDILVYLPTNEFATGQAVVICPGGGYHILAYDKEGTDIAKWLNTLGIAGIVLKYRLPVSSCNVVSYRSPLLDVQRAIRLVRYHAPAWNIRPDKVGVMGFSAGGHLASTAGTHFDGGIPGAHDPVDRISSRPDFMILGYPVISMLDSITHTGSKDALLGPAPPDSLVHYFSNELQVSDQTPPAFLFLADDDPAVNPENSIVFYQALHRHHIPSEMVIFTAGGHGFGGAPETSIPGRWEEICADWLKWIDQHTLYENEPDQGQ